MIYHTKGFIAKNLEVKVYDNMVEFFGEGKRLLYISDKETIEALSDLLLDLKYSIAAKEANED